MLVIKPIQDKEIQKKLVTDCGGTYDAAAFAYLANECEEDGETVRYPIGGCQFAICGEERGTCSLLRTLPGVQDDEGLMIMARAAASFLFRCGVRYLTLLPGAADATIAAKLGFFPAENGAFEMDLLRYFSTPCSERAIKE